MNFDSSFMTGVSESITAALLSVIAAAIWKFLKRMYIKAPDAIEMINDAKIKGIVRENFMDGLQLAGAVLLFIFYPPATSRWDFAVLGFAVISFFTFGFSILWNIAKRQIRHAESTSSRSSDGNGR